MTYNDTAVEVSYEGDYFPAFRKVYGYGMGKLTVKSQDEKPLPIARNGHLERFVTDKYIEENGGIKSMLDYWISAAEKKRKWQKHLKTEQAKAQLRLF